MNSGQKFITIIIAFVFIVTAPTAKAVIIDMPQYKNDLLIDERDIIQPLLRAGITPESTSSSGEFIIGCRHGTISNFSFNVILRSALDKETVDYAWRDVKTFIGIRTSSRNSEELNTLRSGLVIKKYLKITEPTLTVTQEFTPTEISDTGTVFLSSYVDASFLQAVIEGDEIVIAKKFPADNQYIESWVTSYTVVPNYIARFMNLCSATP